jgi:hypothetical protein
MLGREEETSEEMIEKLTTDAEDYWTKAEADRNALSIESQKIRDELSRRIDIDRKKMAAL